MDLSLRELEQAVSLRRQIDALQKRYAGLFGGKAGGGPAPGGRKGRRMSAASRAKIAAAARARWAKIKGRRGGAAKKGGKRKGGLTPAGRRKLSQMMKARWAARRKAQRR